MRPRSRILAAVLAFAGGIIGAHKFYLKDAGGSIFYMFLLFVGTMISIPITFFLGLIDGFKLLGMNDETFDRKYNRGFVQRNPVIERRRDAQMRKYESEDMRRGFQTPSVRVRVNPFKSSGLAKYKDFDLEAAIEDFVKGLEIEPNDIALHFNLACAYSLTEKKDLAFEHLAKSVALGFNDFERIQSHDDLAFVRIQPEYDGFKKSGFKMIPKERSSSAGTKGNNSSTIPQESTEFVLSQIEKLETLKSRGIISESEYVLEKRKLMR
jgi:TM2 domain-containing membrane protein YozV